MTHNEAWHFVRMGRRLERTDKISRMLDVMYFLLLPSITVAGGTPYDDLLWAAVLKSVSGLEMYRKQYGRICPRDILEFLVMDSAFPRTIRHCIRGADESLHAITGAPVGSCSCRSEQLLGMLRAQLDSTSVDRVLAEGLHQYLDGLQIQMNAIDESLFVDFFAWRRQGQSQATGAGNS